MALTDTIRCKKCVLPVHYKEVEFDENGVCSLCRNFKEDSVVLESQRAKLEQIVESRKKLNLPYDCIIPLSGGWDSAYAAYVMRKKYGLRLLGLNVDNGFRTPHALANMDIIAKKLQMDLVTLKPEPGLMGELFGYFLQKFGYFCTVCNSVGYILIGSFTAREARRLGAPPLVVGGWSKKYEFQPGVELFSLGAFARTLSKNKPLFNKLRENILVDPAVFDLFITMGDTRQIASSPHFIQLPDFMDWDYNEIERVLTDELEMIQPGENVPGYEEDETEGAESGESSVNSPGNIQETDSTDSSQKGNSFTINRHKPKRHHYDCSLHPLNEYIKYRRMGISQETLRNSVLIREGRMTREEALEKEELVRKEEPEILKAAMKEWNVKYENIDWDGDWSGLW